VMARGLLRTEGEHTLLLARVKYIKVKFGEHPQLFEVAFCDFSRFPISSALSWNIKSFWGKANLLLLLTCS